MEVATELAKGEIVLSPGLVFAIVLVVVLAVFASTGFWSYMTSRAARKDKKEDDAEETKKTDKDQSDRISALEETIGEIKQQNTLQSNMLKGLGHDRVLFLCDRYVERGYISTTEYNDLFEYIYKPYAALGGNGTAKRAMEEVKSLPSHPSHTEGVTE